MAGDARIAGMAVADPKEVAAVRAVVQTYFDGLHHADSRRLAQVFHPRAIYATVEDGGLLHRDMKTYFDVVDQRISPARRGEMRRDRILSIDFAGPDVASAFVTCAIGERCFTDILTLVRTGGAWQIIAKVFHGAPRDLAAATTEEASAACPM